MTVELSRTLESIGYTKSLNESWVNTLLSELSVQGQSGLSVGDIKNLPLAAFVLMEQGRQEVNQNSYRINSKAKRYFSSAYSALKSTFEYCIQCNAKQDREDQFELIRECPYTDDLGELGLNNELMFGFLLAVSGVLSDRLTEVRHDLKELDLKTNDANWLTSICTSAFVAQILLVRKGEGWKDIDQSFSIISTLASHVVVQT